MRTTEKIVQALAYFAYRQNGHTIDPMKAYKLMWLADRYHMRINGRSITGDSYNALPKGPVPTDTMNIINGQETRMENDLETVAEYLKTGKKITAKKEPDMDVFSDSDEDALALIYDTFGKMTSRELSRLSHEFPDWKEYEDALKGMYSKNSYPIDTDLFFENPEKTSYSELVAKVFNQTPEQLSHSKAVFKLFKGA